MQQCSMSICLKQLSSRFLEERLRNPKHLGNLNHDSAVGRGRRAMSQLLKNRTVLFLPQRYGQLSKMDFK